MRVHVGVHVLCHLDPPVSMGSCAEAAVTQALCWAGGEGCRGETRQSPSLAALPLGRTQSKAGLRCRVLQVVTPVLRAGALAPGLGPGRGAQEDDWSPRKRMWWAGQPHRLTAGRVLGALVRRGLLSGAHGESGPVRGSRRRLPAGW